MRKNRAAYLRAARYSSRPINSYYQLIMTLVVIWAVFGLSYNMLSGYTGLIQPSSGSAVPAPQQVFPVPGGVI